MREVSITWHALQPGAAIAAQHTRAAQASNGVPQAVQYAQIVAQHEHGAESTSGRSGFRNPIETAMYFDAPQGGNLLI